MALKQLSLVISYIVSSQNWGNYVIFVILKRPLLLPDLEQKSESWT